MLDRARAAGISQICMPNIDAGSVSALLAVAGTFPGFCLPMMGLHPCSVQENVEAQIEETENLLKEDPHRYCGIGECGLDYYWDITFAAQQKTAFRTQISWGIQYRKPVIIHSRNATDDCIAMIREQKEDALTGIFHCFSGNEAQLAQVIALGFYAGIGGVATFKNGGLDKILRREHLPHLVLETDAPYLAPVPFRGKRNEPSYLLHVRARLSEILQTQEEEIDRITTENARLVFGIRENIA